MATVGPVALRVVEDSWSAIVPSPAHDSLSPADRRAYLEKNPDSYLGVTRGPEDLAPGQELTNEELLQSGRSALDRLVAGGAFSEIGPERFYLYQLQTKDHTQTAIIATVATEDFADGNVRLHELVQLDRASHLGRHLAVVGAQSSPIALAHQGCDELEQLIERAITTGPALLEFSAGDGVTQRVWSLSSDLSETVQACFADLTLYLIDGHHRAAAARAHNLAVGNHDSSSTFCAIFAAKDLRNRAHHRVLALGEDTAGFLERLEAELPVRVVHTDAEAEARDIDELALWHQDQCYVVRVPFSAASSDAQDTAPTVSERLNDLDPVRLQRGIIGPLLGVDGSWSGNQLTYRPGVRPVAELRAQPGDGSEVLCVMRAVPIEDLLEASDDGLVMPPKSTYFEPKARSGVFVRHLGLGESS